MLAGNKSIRLQGRRGHLLRTLQARPRAASSMFNAMGLNKKVSTGGKLKTTAIDSSKRHGVQYNCSSRSPSFCEVVPLPPHILKRKFLMQDPPSAVAVQCSSEREKSGDDRQMSKPSSPSAVAAPPAKRKAAATAAGGRRRRCPRGCPSCAAAAHVTPAAAAAAAAARCRHRSQTLQPQDTIDRSAITLRDHMGSVISGCPSSATAARQVMAVAYAAATSGPVCTICIFTRG